jgi:hypothetical protein
MTHDELLEKRLTTLEEAYKVLMTTFESNTIAYQAIIAHLTGRDE